MHGDLKPANCLLRSVPAYTDRRGFMVKLADFGLSRLLNPVSATKDGGGRGSGIGPSFRLLTHAWACRLAVLLPGRLAFTCPLVLPVPWLVQDQTSIQTGSYGTPGFAAPELLTEGKLTKAADIFSLGLISASAALGSVCGCA